jgi:hypothetical protein
MGTWPSLRVTWARSASARRVSTRQLQADELAPSPLERRLAGSAGRAMLLVRGPGPATGQVLHRLLDTDDVSLDVLQVQPPSDNLTASDLKQRHPAHLERLPVAACARPPPFGPGRVTVLDRPADLGAEVGDPREHGLPVGEHLGSPGEGPARMRRLLAAVVPVDEPGHGYHRTFAMSAVLQQSSGGFNLMR